LALAYRRQGRFEAVRKIQEMIVETLPGDLPARDDLADTLLTLGDFARGWEAYRYRYHLPHTTALARHIQVAPCWDGRPIPGQTLLIHDEQGYGDTFQFIRLLRAAQKHSEAKILVKVNHESLSLVRRAYPEFPACRKKRRN